MLYIYKKFYSNVVILVKINSKWYKSWEEREVILNWYNWGLLFEMGSVWIKELAFGKRVGKEDF